MTAGTAAGLVPGEAALETTRKLEIPGDLVKLHIAQYRCTNLISFYYDPIAESGYRAHRLFHNLP